MKVLVADKDKKILELVYARLSSRGYEVSEQNTSEKVLFALGRENFDLAIISTTLERINGRHLIEKIREQHHLSTLPIIMMTTEDEISELILGHERGFDDFLIKPFTPLALQLRVAINISRIQMRADANALTHLPGNSAIEKRIMMLIERGDKFSALYIDIDQFKSFNDRYGFEKGDDVIRQTAKLLLQTKEKVCAAGECFVGHIGGDDFLVILDPEFEEIYAKAFIKEFDRLMPTYYSDADQKRGCIEVKNRRGKQEIFPLMSCSVAACTNLYKPYNSLGELSSDAAELKSFLKSQPGSNYLRDRRAMQVDGIDQAGDLFKAEQESDITQAVKGTVDPLGKILLNAGLINEEQLSRAIKKHMLTGQRLGQTLISMNLVRSQDVGRMLEQKLNVPYVSLRDFKPGRNAMRLFTVEFMRSHRVVPLEISGGVLRLGMCDPFDLKTIDAIEDISSLKPVPCLALEDEFEEFIEDLTQKEKDREEIIGF